MVIIFILALLGFLNAFYLYYQHKKEVASGQKMFCLIGGDCGAVVGSKYGTTLGIKNEKIGMVYYLLLGVYLLTSVIWPAGQSFMLAAEILSAIAAVFSIYLLIVQTVILRKLCSWCLIAIAINLLIFYCFIIARLHLAS